MSSKLEKIAEYFIHLSKETNRPISNKKLQKLVYYSQAWTLAIKGTSLFKESIEAWIHGPAIPYLYQKYKKYGFSPIEFKKKCLIPKDLPEKDILDEVWRVYGKYDADYLELLSHQEKPWIEARGLLEFNESSKCIISHKTMKNFYRNFLKINNEKKQKEKKQ
jgi:uncharacterized phage-associated protein